MSIQGRLKDMGLADIIQVFHMQNKTTAIRVGSEQGYGMVYMRGGKVVHATYRDLAGEEAFYHLIGWGDGDFEVETNLASPETTIHSDVERLLLEGVKRIDEDGLTSKRQKSSYGEDVESAQLVKRLVEMGILEGTSD
ncbi:MAG: DUF4388 domain-containing protein [Deltaproteobacteria bacterium]|nr:DUF4388 domain-containing protein [Deltaproteobacteria bacterium]